MKHKLLILLLFIAFALFAQESQIPNYALGADDVIYQKLPNGKTRILAVYVVGETDNDTILTNFKTVQIVGRLNKRTAQELQAEQALANLKADSVALEDLKRKYEQETGLKIDTLLAAKLGSLAGDWVIQVDSTKDQLTIEKNGGFTAKKSGKGVIKLLSFNKMQLKFTGTKPVTLELFEAKESVWVDKTGAKVLLQRLQGAEGNVVEPKKKE